MVSLRSLIIPPAAAVFVLEYTSQKGKSGWQYLDYYGALRYTLSLVNRSVLMTGKAKTEERRCHSECILSRDMKMWPPYCWIARVRCTKVLIKTPFVLCSASARWHLGRVVATLFLSPLHSHLIDTGSILAPFPTQPLHSIPKSLLHTHPSCYLCLDAACLHV